MMAAPMTSPGRFWPLGPFGMISSPLKKHQGYPNHAGAERIGGQRVSRCALLHGERQKYRRSNRAEPDLIDLNA
jgi:hypothetical protein